MGLFGKSKEEKSQDKAISDIWAWIQHFDKWIKHLDKNWTVQIQNNKYYSESIKALKAKDKAHDATDIEIKAALKGIKSMAKDIEQAEQQAEKATET